MKIFLLNPEPPLFRKRFVMRRNRVFPPISLAIIAQALERDGYDIRLLDANALQMSTREIIQELMQFRPDLLIYNSDRHDAWQLPIPSHTYIKELFDAYRDRAKLDATVLAIGPHGTLFPDLLLKEVPAIDFAIRGEPELKTLDFVKALERSEPREAAGASFIGANGEVVNNPDPGFVEDLDALPLPAYHLLPMEKYRDNTAPDERFGLVVTSRGCPMSCVFCSKIMYGSKFRTRSIDKVLEEIDLLHRHYSVRRFFFHDQILLFKRKRIEELLEAVLERGYDFTWRCQTRLFTLDEPILELMKRTGCSEVHVGLETTSSSVQSAVKKADADADKFLEIHEIGRKLGVSISPNMIIGLPGDTRETVLESARFYHSMGFPFLPNVAIPYPDTKLYDIGIEEGKIEPGNWDDIVHSAGMPGNALTKEDLITILHTVDDMNRSLWWSRLSLRQKVRKAPRYFYRKLRTKMRLG